MSSQLPEKKQRKGSEPFGEIVKSMNAFFTERPLKGVLESIDDFFKNPFANLSFPVEVVESNKEYLITAELPGISKEQIQLETAGNQLTILINNSETLTENDDINKIYRRRNSIQKSSRSIHLPDPINEKLVKASYKDGLLLIRIPRNSGKSIQID